MTQTIEQLTARVRELEEENARLKAAVDYAETIRVENIAYFEKQLAASQAYAEQLREAIEQITKQMFTSYKAKNGRDCYIEDDSGELCYIVPHEPIITAQHAIAIPHDTSALDAYVAKRLHDMACDKGLLRIQVEELTRQRDLAVEALESISKITVDAGFNIGGPLKHCPGELEIEEAKRLLILACEYLKDTSKAAF